MDLRDLLARIIAGAAGGEGAVGIAVASRADGPPEVVWTPDDAAEEPGYLAYSITKTLIASLLLLLSDAGRLALSDPLARWFPRIAGADRIALRHLLQHTAGVPDYGGLRSYHDAVRASPSAPWSFEHFAAETFDKGLDFEPGAGWAYSNPGYMLLRRIAEEVSGAPFATLISDRLARPIGLRRTFAVDSLEDLSGLAPARSHALAVDGTLRDVRLHYHPGWVSHGVVASTPSDIAFFFQALFAGLVISARSLREMTALTDVSVKPEDLDPRWRRPGYGLGIMGDPESPWGRLWGHHGGGPGYRASAFHAADRGSVSVCAMGAREGDFDAERLVLSVFDALDDRSGRP